MDTYAIGQAVGKTIKYGAAVAIAVGIIAACSGGSKWMSAKDLIANDSRLNSPEEAALIASFDKDNGNVYCVPKMSGAELGEFRAKIPGLMVGSVFQGLFNGEGMKDFNQDKPIESVLRITFTKSHPCK